MGRVGEETESGGGDGETIGALAAAFNLTPRTIRYYEDQGLLAPGRAGAQRVYRPRDRARLGLICRGKRLGFTIAEIRDFLDLYEARDGQIEQMRYLLGRGRSRIAALEQQLRDVQQTLTDLYGLVEAAAGHLRRHGIEEGTAP
ncbi:MAG: MerR family DNA-binding transcriptional regulator [Rhodospirillaceae bacterium]